MQKYVNMVQEFHDKMRVSSQQPISTEPLGSLEYMGNELIRMSEKLLPHINVDVRFLRTHLELEEMGEKLIAYSKGDLEEYADGMADLLYVLLGACATHSLPIEQLLLEVHASNMSKEKQLDDPHKDRVRDKGPNYSPPDIIGVLNDEQPRHKSLYDKE